MEELIKSIKAALYDRLGNPFFGSFIFSWLVINWQIPYILFIDDEYLKLLERIALVQKDHLSMWSILIYPLAVSIFYIFIYSFFTIQVLKYTTRFRNEQSKTVDIESGKRMLSIKESMENTQELQKVRNETEVLFEHKNKQINDLQSEKENYNNEVTRLNQVIKINNDNIEKEKHNIESSKNSEINKITKEFSIYRDSATENFARKKNEISEKDLFIETLLEIFLLKAEEKDRYVLKQFNFLKNNPIFRFDGIYKEIIIRKNIKDQKDLDILEFLEKYKLIEVSGIGDYKFSSEGKTFLKSYLETNH